MRVIAGVAKGRRLKSLPGSATRPVTDRVKEALFSILGPRVEGARFLDLYAGTGSVGIEALSRGADEVVLVEMSRKAGMVIRDNLRATRLWGRAKVVQGEVSRFLARAEGPFDIIYLAPPQYKGLWAKTVTALDGLSLLAGDGLIVAQMYPKEYQELPLTALRLVETRRYGSTLLVFYAPS